MSVAFVSLLRVVTAAKICVSSVEQRINISKMVVKPQKKAKLVVAGFFGIVSGSITTFCELVYWYHGSPMAAILCMFLTFSPLPYLLVNCLHFVESVCHGNTYPSKLISQSAFSTNTYVMQKQSKFYHFLSAQRFMLRKLV